MLSSASSMIVRLRRPRKSIFSSPSVSQTPMSNCVMIAPSASRRWIGMTSISGLLDMITPAACTPHCRLRPSRSAGGVDDLLDLRVDLVERPHLGGLGVALVAGVEHPGERDVLAHDRGRHRLGDAVGHRVAGLAEEHPRRVLDRGLRLDRGVGDDLRDPVLAVLLGDVADHLAAPALVEVHVDVGHRDALGVEEPLEDQLVLDRVEVGDAQDVGDERARRRPAAGAARGCRPTWRAG